MANSKDRFKATLHYLTNISEYIDTEEAAASIRRNIYFRGVNVWILAFSIIIASVGLNVNSTAVIIGAMLISPLMGPIIGLGLGLGTNDTQLIGESAKNLLVMVVISLTASFLYFLITPLRLANPTELLARTNPTIYDVVIALFGGLAGIFEISRKEKGTVLSGVAIATALMPPLCTAGYGLSILNFRYFFGALYLFCINGIFISLATFLAVKYLKFKEVVYQDEQIGKRRKSLITLMLILFIIPSIWSAFLMIRDNQFKQGAFNFIAESKYLSNSYISDYTVDPRHGKITLYLTGGTLTAADRNTILAAAQKYGFDQSQLEFKEHLTEVQGNDASEKLVKGIYERTDNELRKRETEIRMLQTELARLQATEIPYAQITREMISQYPEVQEVFIGKGASMQADSLWPQNRIMILTRTQEPLAKSRLEKMEEWLKIRLSDSTVVVLNPR